jgi:hypothetical protein
VDRNKVVEFGTNLFRGFDDYDEEEEGEEIAEASV